MTSTANRLGHRAISIVAALAFFFSLWILDFPKPMFDDLFYTGAALNMAKGGDFSNPLLARQGFPSHYFFVYPPLHSYVLAVWLKIFGISSGSMTGFAIFLIAVTSVATIAVLRRHEAGIWLELGVPLGAAFALLPLGLRPDTLGVALAMAGFTVVDWKPTAGIPLASGFLLMFLGASAAPRVTIFALALAAAASYECCRQADTWQTKWRKIALIICAALGTCLVFACLIHFRFIEFLATFRFHAGRLSETNFERLITFVIYQLRVLHWPLVLIPFALVIFLWRKEKDRLSVTGIFALAAFPLAAAAGLIWLGATWWPILAMLFLGGAASKIVSAPCRTGLTTVILAVLLVANRRDFINVAGILSGKISADLGEERTVALAIHPSSGCGLLIDCWVARYLYDYRIPEGVLNFEFGNPFPGTMPGYGGLPPGSGPEFRPGDVFLAGPRVVSILIKHTYLERAIPMWNPFGLSKFALERNPSHIYVIAAEACKGTREKALL